LYRAELANTDPAEVEALVRSPYIDALFELLNLCTVQRNSQQALATIRTLEEQVNQSGDGNSESQAILENLAGLRDVIGGGDASKAMKKNQDMMRNMFGAKPPGQPPEGQTTEMKAQAEKIQAAEAADMTAYQQMEDLTSAMKLVSQGKYPEAERALTNLIEPQRAKGGADVLLWTSMLAEVYRLQGKYDEARVTFESARDSIRKVLGEDHPSLAACHFGLAQTLLSEKKFEQAETESRAALAFYERRMPGDLLRFELKGMIGSALTGQKKYAAAEPLLLAGYEGFKRQENTIPAIGATRLPHAVDRLIEFYSVTNQPHEVKKWQAERAKYPTVAPMPREKKLNNK
jgi:tetratricopeptide (TPR) repeat protein